MGVHGRTVDRAGYDSGADVVDAENRSIYAMEGTGKLDVGCTLVVWNITNTLTQIEVLQRFKEYGFGDDVVLPHMPWLMASDTNIGYAFVHIQTLTGREALVDAWHGKFPLGSMPGLKAVNIAFSAVQGAAENIAVWSSSRKIARIRNRQLRPMIIKQIDNHTGPSPRGEHRLTNDSMI